LGSPKPPKGKPSETPTHHPLLPSSDIPKTSHIFKIEGDRGWFIW